MGWGSPSPLVFSSFPGMLSGLPRWRWFPGTSAFHWQRVRIPGRSVDGMGNKETRDRALSREKQVLVLLQKDHRDHKSRQQVLRIAVPDVTDRNHFQ